MGSNVTPSVLSRRWGIPVRTGLLVLLVALCLHALGCGEESESVEETEKAQASWADNCETIVVLRGATTQDELKSIRVDVEIRLDTADEGSGVYFLDAERFERLESPEALEERLRLCNGQLREPDKTVVLLYPHPKVWWQWVTRAMDSAYRAGFEHVAVINGSLPVATLAKTSFRDATLPDNAILISDSSVQDAKKQAASKAGPTNQGPRVTPCSWPGLGSACCGPSVWAFRW